MMIDKNLVFSEEQKITATAASAKKVDTIDGGAEYSNLWVVVLVKEAFNTATSLTLSLRQADAEGMGSADTLVSTVVPLADLKAGAAFGFRLPLFNKRYLDMNYTVTGSNPTTGKITAFITDAFQTAGE